MKNTLFVCLLVTLFFSCQQEEKSNYVSTVNPFIGTDYTGNTYPGAQMPFGMVQLSPDNGLPGWDRIAGYFYPDSTIAGFSHTHLSGTGAGDLYDISFMPVVNPIQKAAAPLGIHSTFSHSDEYAEAGYYRVLLSDYQINVELTATPRCGIQSYTYPEKRDTGFVYLNLVKSMNWDATVDSHMEVVDSVTIRGYRFSDGWAQGQKVFFVTRFSHPFTTLSTDTTVIAKGEKQKGLGYLSKFSFNTAVNKKLLVVTALSGTSMEGAMRNLQAEATSNDFDTYRSLARQSWNHELNKIQIETSNADQRAIFYTALYHSMLAPTIYSDVDHSYYGPDKQIHTSTGWTNYTTFSLWDTYRALHPLLTYLAPNRVGDMVESLLAFFDQNGQLPVWNMYGYETDMMIGYHAVPVIVDAYLKGIGTFDAAHALKACVATANLDAYRGIGLYKKYGYVPYNLEKESLSKTLEYAYDDYCIALMAQKMGQDSLAAVFFDRSSNYKNSYNPATSFMQPKDDKGAFISSFHPQAYTEDITESNAWQYFWSVPHDVEGLMQLVGGRKSFAAKLDSMFTLEDANKHNLPIFSTGMIGQYAQGNEPSHHVIYLYNKANQPAKTQRYVHQVMHSLYRNTPDGLCGNDDCGQTSAWYVMSAMGFYPVNPVGDQYEIGTPLFPSMKLALANGKTFTVLAPAVNEKNLYVKSVKVNNVPYDKSYITHEQIMSGSTIEFEMTDVPAAAWYTRQ